MYRVVELVKSDQDFHRFVWRSEPDGSLKDYQITRATFGVSASCFAANMAVKQNTIDLSYLYPLAAEAVEKSFYVDDGLTGAGDTKTATTLRHQLCDLFSRGGFVLWKWNSSDPTVLQAIPPDLRDSKEVLPISDSNGSTKTLDLEWNTTTDTFHLTISKFPQSERVTKRLLASDVAKVYDIVGWYFPVTVTMKILLQKILELRVYWDDFVPDHIQDVWFQWRSELPVLSTKPIPRCYIPKGAEITSTQLHGFSDASEDAYAGVVYLRMIDSVGDIHTSLVISKT